MHKYLILLAVVCAALFTFSSCSDTETTPEDNLKKGQEYLEKNAAKSGVIVTTSGLQYEVLQEGTGKSPKATDLVKCYYEGRFINGTIFDKTTAGKPATFPLNQVIMGWTEGLQLMKEGAKYRFTIPYFLGYGPYDYATIPGYSVLIFDVELLEVL